MFELKLTPPAARQLRGLLLRLIYVNHNTQHSRTNSNMLWAVLQREGYGSLFDGEDVLTMLQDLRDREYIRYEQMRTALGSSKIYIFNIEITAEGRDLMDGGASDPMVQTD